MIVPKNPTTFGNIGFVLLVAMLIGLVQVRGRWRTLTLVLTLYLSACVWEARLVTVPAITRQILIGAILIVMMNARPQGLLGRDGSRCVVMADAAPLLELAGMGVAFWRACALSLRRPARPLGRDLRHRPRRVVSVIGPNGAGKTTIFNVITGVYTPSEGDVLLDGESLVGKPLHAITRQGVARTFQSLRLFLNMSVMENVIASTYGGTKAMPWESMLRLPRARREEREVRARAEEVLSFFGQRLAGYRWDQPAYSLSYANRRRLEIARALATEPKLLLLDEPAAGMNPNETPRSPSSSAGCATSCRWRSSSSSTTCTSSRASPTG